MVVFFTAISVRTSRNVLLRGYLLHDTIEIGPKDVPEASKPRKHIGPINKCWCILEVWFVTLFMKRHIPVDTFWHILDCLRGKKRNLWV